MAADGGVDFAVRLINNVTGPAKQIQRSMADVTKVFRDAKRVVEAPAPKRGVMSDWDRMTAKAKMSQAKDFARAQSAAAKLVARDQIREAKRVADFKAGMAQLDADNSLGSILGGAAGGIAAGATAAIMAAGAAVAYLGYQFAQSAVQAASFGQTSQLALSLLIGDSKVAAREFDAVRMEAQQLGLDVQDTQLGFQKLLAAQFEIGKAKELIRMSADLQAIGASADQTKRAIVAISQIKNTGYLQGDELNQLREAGISTELIYKSLGQRLNKTVPEIIKMQEKRQLDSTSVIESILEAVRVKTGSSVAGEAGRKAAETTLPGMGRMFLGQISNFMIDVGEAILPGLEQLASLAKGTFDKLTSDPKVQKFGYFMLSSFYRFTGWVEQNWPAITDALLMGAQVMAAGLEFVVEMFDQSTFKGQVVIGILKALAAAFVIAAVAIAPFVAISAAIVTTFAVAISVVGELAMFVYDQFKWLYDQIAGLFGVEATPASPPTLDPGPMIATAAEDGSTAGMFAAFASMGNEQTTVAAEPQDKLAAGHHFDFSGMVVGDNVDKDALAAQIKTAVNKALEEAA